MAQIGNYSAAQANVKISTPFAYLSIVLTFIHGSTPANAAALLAAFRTDCAGVYITLRRPDGSYAIPRIAVAEAAEIYAGWSSRFIKLSNNAAVCTAALQIPIGCTGSVPASSGNEYVFDIEGLPGAFTISADCYATPVDTLGLPEFKLVPVPLNAGQQKLQLRNGDMDLALAVPSSITALQMQGQCTADYKPTELSALLNEVSGVNYILNGSVETVSNWYIIPINAARAFLITMAAAGTVYLVRRINDVRYQDQ